MVHSKGEGRKFPIKFAFESVIKVSFLLSKFLGLVKNETNKTVKHFVQDREKKLFEKL